MNKRKEAKNSTDSTRNRQKRAFLESLKSGVTIKDASEKAGIDRTTVWLWRKKWKGFDNKIFSIIDSRTQTVEDALYGSALSGNVAAQIFWLKNRAKDRWKDKQEYDVKHSGEIDSKLTYILEMEDKELDKIIDKYTKKEVNGSHSGEEKKRD